MVTPAEVARTSSELAPAGVDATSAMPTHPTTITTDVRRLSLRTEVTGYIAGFVRKPLPAPRSPLRPWSPARGRRPAGPRPRSSACLPAVVPSPGLSQ